MVEDGGDRLVLGERAGVDPKVGIQRFVIWVGDAGELWDETGAGLGVEPLEVPPLALGQRGVDVDENEVADGVRHGSDLRAGARVRRDRRADGDPAVLGDERADIPDPTDVHDPGLAVEAKPGGEHLSDDVAVQQAHRPSARGGQRLGEAARDGRLARAGEPAEHDDQTTVRSGGPPSGEDVSIGHRQRVVVGALVQGSGGGAPTSVRGQSFDGGAAEVAPQRVEQRRIARVVAPSERGGPHRYAAQASGQPVGQLQHDRGGHPGRGVGVVGDEDSVDASDGGCVGVEDRPRQNEHPSPAGARVVGSDDGSAPGPALAASTCLEDTADPSRPGLGETGQCRDRGHLLVEEVDRPSSERGGEALRVELDDGAQR